MKTKCTLIGCSQTNQESHQLKKLVQPIVQTLEKRDQHKMITDRGYSKKVINNESME